MSRYIEISRVKEKLLPIHKSGRQQTASGYGSKLVMPYVVQLRLESRWRRVYCCCYSNSGSLYILIDGKKEFVDFDKSKVEK